MGFALTWPDAVELDTGEELEREEEPAEPPVTPPLTEPPWAVTSW